MLRLVYIIRTIQPVLWCYSMAAVRPREGVTLACPRRVSSLPLLLKESESYLYPITRGKHFIRDSSTATPRPSTPSTSSFVFVVLLAVLIFSVYFKSIFCGPDIGGAVCGYVITYINISRFYKAYQFCSPFPSNPPAGFFFFLGRGDIN